MNQQQQESYMLYFSNKCLHSKELLNLLSKDASLNEKILKVNVDLRNVQIPPYVKSVPTMVMVVNQSAQMMVGTQIFQWYESMHKKAVSSQQILDWDPWTMSGYSDGFSYLQDSGIDKKSFSGIDENFRIHAPEEGSFVSDKKENVKTELDKSYESYMSQRKLEVPSAQPRIG